MKSFLGWSWFVVVQLIMLTTTVVGWFVLIPFCLAQAWTEPKFASINNARDDKVDGWRLEFLDRVYGNPEDGVSGQQALVWTPTGQVPYMPNAWAPWRAYCWSAWRNSCDSLKYMFAWKNGPQAEWRGHKLGWWPENGFKVPLL